MEELMQYIRPELLAVAVVLYLVGMGLKKADVVKDKWIPIVLGGVGVIICGIYIFATCTCDGIQGIAMAVFTAITQGIVVAGLSIYIPKMMEIIKNKNDKEETDQKEN